jgi:hypothetical protein
MLIKRRLDESASTKATRVEEDLTVVQDNTPHLSHVQTRLLPTIVSLATDSLFQVSMLADMRLLALQEHLHRDT